MRRVLVTGANKGIGRALVAAILAERPDATVLLGSRDRSRGDAAREGLLARHPAWSGRLQVVQLDVTDDASVLAAAEEVSRLGGERPAPLAGLVNNAGIGGGHGLRAALDVNVLGMRRVCEAFVPLLEPSGGRIVNVTSAAGPSFVAQCAAERQAFLTDPQIEWSALESFMNDCLAVDGGADAFASRGLGDGGAYGLSKACANAYTLIVAREHPELVINACTPGFIETDMTRPFAAAQGKAPSDLGMKPPEAGTVAPRFLLFGEPAGSGHFYGSDARRSPLDRYRSPGTPAYAGGE